MGAGIRATRIRRAWRQADLAAAARVSATTISRIERGTLAGIPIGTLGAVAATLELGIEVRLRSRDGDVDRLVNSRHAALAEGVIAWVQGFRGWTVRPELSFSVYGERGAIDLVLWHAASRRLIVVELKTEIVDVAELLGTLDRKLRLAAAAVRPLGWLPERTGAALIVAASSTNRRRVAAHLTTFRAALPDGQVALRASLRTPADAGPDGLRALAFFSDNRHRNARSRYASVRRVHRPRGTSAERGQRSAAANPAAQRPDTAS